MAFPMFWSEVWVTALVNHLWQSTVVAGIVWLLAMLLRKNHASTRYWVWLIASVKFLLPFSLLIHIGEALRPLIDTPLQSPRLVAVIEKITQPFLESALLSAFSPGTLWPQILLFLKIMFPILLATWLCGFFVVSLSWLRDWLKVHATVQSATRVHTPVTPLAEIPVLSSPKLPEPGIFGIVRPVLLLPKGIDDHLTAEQLRTIIAHEMCHVRRRDNLTAALHLVVAALFWFYPAVWWIKKRMLEERERACDEAVLQSGNDAELYAESILKVCKFYLESPRNCVSAATGSDLNERIVRIMTAQPTHELNLGRRLLLGLTATVTLAVPVIFGLVHIQQDRIQITSENHAQITTGAWQGADLANRILLNLLYPDRPTQPPPATEIQRPVFVPIELPSTNHARPQLNRSEEPNRTASKTDLFLGHTERILLEMLHNYIPDPHQEESLKKI